MNGPPRLPAGAARSLLEIAVLGTAFTIIYGMGAAWFLMTIAGAVRTQASQLGWTTGPATMLALMTGIAAVVALPIALHRELAKLIETMKDDGIKNENLDKSVAQPHLDRADGEQG